MIFKQNPWTSSLEGHANKIKNQKSLFLGFQNWKHEKKLYFSNCPRMWKTLVQDVTFDAQIAEGDHHGEMAEYGDDLSQNWTMSSNLDNYGCDGNVISGDLINWHFVKIKHLANSKPVFFFTVVFFFPLITMKIEGCKCTVTFLQW